MWPDLKIPPINLWNVPYMFKERNIIDRILDAVLRFYIKTGKDSTVLYLGRNEKKQHKNMFMETYIDGDCNGKFHHMEVVYVDKEDYLRVG